MDFDVKDLVGVAGSAVGLIIACAIFHGGVNGKFVPMYQRYEELHRERREDKPHGARGASVTAQLDTYERRLQITRLASQVLTSGLLFFFATVLFSCLSVVFKGAYWTQVAVLVNLAAGLLMMVVGAVLEFREMALLRHTLATLMSEGAAEPRPLEASAGQKLGQPARLPT